METCRHNKVTARTQAIPASYIFRPKKSIAVLFGRSMIGPAHQHTAGTNSAAHHVARHVAGRRWSQNHEAGSSREESDVRGTNDAA